MNSEQGTIHYHLVGIGGVGMSALAQAVISQGYVVSGSDRDRDQGKDLAVFPQLKYAGIQFYAQDGSGVSEELAGVVVSTAIEEDNPDLARARQIGVPILHRAEMLAQLLEGKRCVAVTGTSGKSSVTGMIGWILEQVGADPTVVNGAAVVNWRSVDAVGNFRKGGSNLWIIEADESDRSLLSFEPDWAVITNVSEDHFALRETENLFEQFCDRVRNKCLRGLDDSDALKRVDSSTGGAVGSTFRYNGVDFLVPLIGRHNAENALYAVALCELLGYGLQDIRDALASFKGIHRRLELVGEKRGVKVMDDYAHNPAKIQASLSAVTSSSDRVSVIWRPHGYGPLKTMMDGLVKAFSSGLREQDRLFVLPVYDAGGTADRSIDSGAFVSRLVEEGVAASTCDTYADVSEMVAGSSEAGDLAIVMGARDPRLPELALTILEKL